MSEERQGKVIITVAGRDEDLEQEALGINMDSSEAEILAAAQGAINETLTDNHGEFAFTVRKSINTGCIYIHPKSPAG